MRDSVRLRDRSLTVAARIGANREDGISVAETLRLAFSRLRPGLAALSNSGHYQDHLLAPMLFALGCESIPSLRGPIDNRPAGWQPVGNLPHIAASPKQE